MPDEQKNKSFIASPPPPEMTIRTMESDLKSLKESGGIESMPQTFQPSFESNEESADPSSFAVQGYAGPEKPIFEAGVTIIPSEEKNGNSPLKIIIAVIAAVVLVAIFWVFGYYFIFPLLFPPQMPSVK